MSKQNAAPAAAPAGQDAAPHLGHVTPMNLRDAGAQIGALDLGDDDDVLGVDDGTENQANPKKEPKKPRQNDDADSDELEDSGDNQADDTEDEDEELQSDDEDDADSDADDDGADDVAGIKTLSDLAGALDVELDFFDNLELTFRADGKDVTVPLSELRAGYQKDANYRRQTQQVKEQRSELAALKAQQSEEFSKSLVQTGQVLQHAEQLLLSDLNSAEMHALRATKPEQWTAKNQEITQRLQYLRNLYAQTAKQYDDYHEKQKAEAAAQKAERQENARNKLLELVPNWSDAVDEQLTSYLTKTHGFTAEQLNEIDDAVHISIAYKAMMYDKMKAATKDSKKKIAKLPKAVKPGKPAAPQAKGRANLQQAKARLKKTGNIRDAGALLSQLID